MIFDEVIGGYFCILVDESQDESKKEQKTLIFRYVKNDGLLGEWLFDIVGVENTYALTFKKEISNILSRFNLPIQNMRGQGYDGASNMRGEWNGLQALFLKDCPYAYYVHCFADRLQLALITVAKDEPNVWQFFSHLSCIVNRVASSSKCLGELKSFHRSVVENMLASGERQSGKRANQIGTLYRARATCWSSHYESVRNLIDMYEASCVVVESLNKSTNQQIRGQADGVYKVMKSFEFIFILHLMDNILGIVNALCQALQQKT
ncbi:zinc finger MYM-type protein 1-like [Camellia sinensis]|uniref:zinc finger MYM-type protein 1-like n=1 Tax=Camellia sinensis TaxID=4442 RepID=UPI001035ED89|nr:zinc finger MYM-type protein 1-like [Camellia sinensis]